MKNISVWVTIGLFFVGIIAGWGTLKANVSTNEKDIDKLKAKVEILTTSTDKTEISQENTMKQIDKLDDKLDKITTLLIDIKKQR